MTIAGSIWDELNRVEAELAANIDRIDKVVGELHTNLLAMDARINELNKKTPRKTKKEAE